GQVNVPLADFVLSEEYAASRLVYDYLGRRLEAEGRSEPRFAALGRLIEMADDNDRWLHRVPGSRELAGVVRVLGAEAYDDLLASDAQLTYPPRMAAARDRVAAEAARSLAVASARRVERRSGGDTRGAAAADRPP